MTPPANGEPPTQHRFASGRLSLAYAAWGDPAAPVLLLVHGGMDHCRNWDWVAAAFASKWRVVAPDLRGHGDSDWAVDGDYSMAGMVFDLASLSRTLGDRPVSIIGHSLGGNIALRFAATCPQLVRRLVVIEGLGLSPRLMAEREARTPQARLADWIEERRQALARTQRRYPSLEAACARMRAQHPFLTEQQAMHLTLHGTRQAEDGSYGWKFDPLFRSQPPPDLPAVELQRLWAGVLCPTLLVYGGKSWASNPEVDGRASHFPDARFVLFGEGGHWLHHQETAAFVAEVGAFLMT